MHWRDSNQPDEVNYTASVADVAFRMECPRIVVDHAYALLQSIQERLPWFAAEEKAGVHSIHGAESSHGWFRPADGKEASILLSKRVPMVLRVPLNRVTDCDVLSGMTLPVADTVIKLGRCKVRPIRPSPTLFARRIVTGREEPEAEFLDRIQNTLRKMDITAPKLLPGRSTTVDTPEQRLTARSLLLADLSLPDSVRVQETGLGEGRKLGCGLFVPYKSITPVKRAADS